MVLATLRKIDKIYSTTTAFAVMLKATTVVTWGGKYDGGDYSKVKAALREVDKILSPATAYVALLEAASVGLVQANMTVLIVVM